MRFAFAKKTLLISLLLPCLYFTAAGAAFLYKLNVSNRVVLNVNLPTFPKLNSSKRIIIFSPHPDDETLGCAGLIQQAVAAGSQVRVVFLTNGDGFRVAVARQLRRVDLTPQDYIQFAGMRQNETYAALGNLGLGKENVTFLGYPDRGLMPLWNDFWKSDKLFTSAYTKVNRSPYSIAYQHSAKYCGETVLADIEKIVREFQPTDILVTHPSDDHLDHSAASSFVTMAYLQLKSASYSWVDKCKLSYYLVHRGDWPVPQGLYKENQLVPPTEMQKLDTKWTTLGLSATEINRKEKSIELYESQTGVMKRFLMSFARHSEIYGSLAPSIINPVPEMSIRPDGDVADWKGIAPAALDPVNDSLLRDFQRGGDLRAIYAVHDSKNLYLRFDTYKPVSSQIEFLVHLRYFDCSKSDQSSGMVTVKLKSFNKSAPPEFVTSVKGSIVEISIPLTAIGNSHNIAVAVESRVAGLLVDSTGSRFMSW